MVRKVAIFSALAFACLSWGAQALAFDAGAVAPAAAPAAAPTPTTLPAVDASDPAGLFKYIVQAVRESRWAWLVGLIFMLLTWAINRLFKERIPKKVLPWVAISLGVGANIAMSIAGGMVWYEAIGNGISLGMAASGGWSTVGKHLLPGAKKA